MTTASDIHRRAGGPPMTSTRLTCLVLASTVATAILPMQLASAGVFDVKGAGIEKGEREISENFTYQNGFSADGDRTRSSLEIAGAWSPSAWMKLGAKVAMDKPSDADWQASAFGGEVQFSFGEPMKGVALGWFTGVDAGIHKGETNAVVFGPIIQFGNDDRSLTFNTFFEKTFGNNREEGTAFTYAVQAKTSLREGFAIGVEAFGTIPNIGNAPSADEQDHRIGPVLYFDGALTRAKDGPTWAIELGGFVGLTEATPDTSAKLKAAVLF